MAAALSNVIVCLTLTLFLCRGIEVLVDLDDILCPFPAPTATRQLCDELSADSQCVDDSDQVPARDTVPQRISAHSAVGGLRAHLHLKKSKTNGVEL